VVAQVQLLSLSKPGCTAVAPLQTGKVTDAAMAALNISMYFSTQLKAVQRGRKKEQQN
jgi:hypothetical protein